MSREVTRHGGRVAYRADEADNPLAVAPYEEEMVGELSVWVRNNLAHFSPKLWSIEIPWIKVVVKPTARIIRFLAL